MVENRSMSLEQIRGFLEASGEIEFVGKNRKEVYNWVGQTLVGQQYHILLKEEKGLLRSYLGKKTGLSGAQVTRLIGQYLDKGSIEEKVYNRRRFPSLYTRADIGLLAEVDEAHETLSGPRLRAESGGDAENPVPGVSRIRGFRIRAAVPNLGAAHL